MLILICIGISETSGQKNLSGNFNQPKAHVNTIGSNKVTVDNIAGFETGDTVLLIQIQGIEIITVNDPTFGTPWAMLGQPGMHEFIIISAVNAPDEIVFEKNIRNAFNPAGKIQLIRVPYYNSAIVTGNLTCDPWDPGTGKGGVLALITGRSLKLNADIDVSGLGFRGALDAANPDGRCSEDLPLTKAKSYPAGFLNAGFKGEGMAIHNDLGALLYPTQIKGEGPCFTGGGGGNGRYSGGGGGSNYGYGGIGGYEDCSLTAPMPGGSGGIGLVSYSALADRIRLGGGGGASTSSSGLSGSGGNGGGIVIIVTDTILSTGGKIIANGGTGGNAILNGGAGGGGGGGTIAIYTNNYGSETLTLSVAGGKGGENSQSFGEGGGGGGGLIYVSTATTGNVSSQLNGGVSSASMGEGQEGIKQTDFKAILNGFLYNSIRSSVSGNQVDSVCSNIVSPKIQGTKPVGGTLPYIYKWEKSYDSIAWITLANDADPTNYTPLTPEVDTVWYKRTITDSSPDPLVDESLPVKIIVQPFIKNNTIGRDTIICYGQDPVPLTSTGVLTGGNDIYTYVWQDSSKVHPWTDIAGIISKVYDSPALTDTTSYRRTVISGRCRDSSALVYIKVLPTISNNYIRNLPPEICNGMTFDNLLGTTPATIAALAGGDGTFKFRWEGNINGTGWTDTLGTINLPDYNPRELSEKIPSNEYYFRRVVLSGAGDVCTSVSNTVPLKDFPVITNNTIAPVPAICSGSNPADIVGSISPTLSGGNLIYSYSWEDSTKSRSWTAISSAALSDFPTSNLTDTTSYRRIVYSSACSDISNSVRIDVHKSIGNNSISIISSGIDTTLWSGKVPHRLKGTVSTGGKDIPGDYAYQWLFSTTASGFVPVSSGGTGIDYLPAASLTETTYYKRQATSGECTDISSTTITVNVLPLISGNTISNDTTICPLTAPVTIKGSGSGGGTGTYAYYWEQLPEGSSMWSGATGTRDSRDYSPPALATPMKYRRIVTSGSGDLCKDTSGVMVISFYIPPSGMITNNDPVTICGGSEVLLNVKFTGAGPWKVTYMENSVNVPVSTPFNSDTSTIHIIPASIDSLNIYTYSLSEVKDIHGCLASSLSGTRIASVFRFPIANAGTDTSVCGMEVRLSAKRSVGSRLWTFPTTVSTAAANYPVMSVKIDSSFAAGNIVHRFYWEETNWLCRSKDSVDITFYKRISHINAGPDTTIYSLYKRIDLVSDDPEKWETATWTTAAGSGNFIDKDGDSYFDEITGLTDGLNTFELKISNGKCSRTDLMSIINKPIEIPEGFSPNNDPDGYNNTFVIKGLDLPNQIVVLKVFNGAGTEVFSTSNRNGNERWIDWDGKNSRGFDLPEGTYYYLLTIAPKENSGGKDLFKGFIILKRF